MREANRLTPAIVASLEKPGLYSDGLGLYLQVAKGGSKSWIYRFMLNGKPRKMGLGPAHTITIIMARKRAAECRLKVYDGIDPIESRRRKPTWQSKQSSAATK